MKSKITLKELSKLLNVSVSTVSKALNNSPEISEKTIKRVKELAAFHNYRPNPTAVNLKSSKSGTIAVIVPNVSNAFFAKVLSGIEEEAQKKGLQVITYISNESYEREKQITEMISYGFVDGVLIAASEESQKLEKFDHFSDLLEYDLPIVLYDRINISIPVDKIGVDDRGSIYEAAKLFMDQGLKKIGFVSAIHHLDVGINRIEGFKDAVGKETTENLVTSEDTEDLRKKIISLMENGIEGVICSDFMSTLLTSRAAYELNMKIPDELKIIGYVNEELAPFLSPSLSYIDQHPRKIGEKAVQTLFYRINNKNSGKPIEKEILKTSLVHLESSKF